METSFIDYADAVIRLATVEQQEANIYCRQLLEWLSSDDYEETHEGYYRKRCKNTGQWLLDDPRFISWRDEAQSGLLWCHGTRKWSCYTSCIPIFILTYEFKIPSGLRENYTSVRPRLFTERIVSSIVGIRSISN